MPTPCDVFHETAHAVTGTCLISFDRNRYQGGERAVQVRAHADRIVVRLRDEVIVNGHPVLRANATPSITRCRVMTAR